MREMNHSKEISDLGLATFLNIINHQMIATPKANGHRSVFIFQASEKIEEDILAFYNRTARVDPLNFIETYRNLKALTY